MMLLLLCAYIMLVAVDLSVCGDINSTDFYMSRSCGSAIGQGFKNFVFEVEDQPGMVIRLGLSSSSKEVIKYRSSEEIKNLSLIIESAKTNYTDSSAEASGAVKRFPNFDRRQIVPGALPSPTRCLVRA